MIDWDNLVLAPLEGVFGEAVTFIPSAGPQYPGTGVFDEAYREVDLAGGVGVTTESPVLGIRTSQTNTVLRQGDQVYVNSRSVTYVIREVRSDGHGFAKLILNEV